MATKWIFQTLTAFLLASGVVSTAFAQTSEKEQALQQISEIEAGLATIERTVEREDLGRLHLLKQQMAKLKTTVNARGISHMATIREYQVVIVSFRYSTAYFASIATEATEPVIEGLSKIVARIVDERGFDDSPYTHIAEGTFTQVHKLMMELMALPIDPVLKAKLTELLPDVGRMMALSRQGDMRETVLNASVPLVLKLKELYPDFYRVGRHDRAFDVVLNIQGLVDFYADFAQVRSAETR